MAPAFSIGIDLGTTHCALAAAPIGAHAAPAAVFPIAQIVAPGERQAQALLPSFLYLPAQGELAAGALALPWDEAPTSAVGAFARAQGASVPARVVASAKSWLSHPGVDRRADILPWQAPDEVPRVSAVEASTRYLMHMKAAWDAEHPAALLSDQDVVLTVPASFDPVARELTLEACQRAGLSVRLLEEPQAALYAWLADRGAAFREAIRPGDVILVIDIGGGTTDFSLIAAQEEEGVLALERVAVGDHILLGGDNMDAALAHGVRARMEKNGASLDDWQMRSLVHACRVAKEALLSDASLSSQPIAIAGRSSRLIGSTLRASLDRTDLEALLLDGFLPLVDAAAGPQAPKRAGLQTLGLPYASDAAITRHLAAFLRRSSAPTAVLFNGGVTRSPFVRERLLACLSAWTGREMRVLEGSDADLAVARGAAYYAQVQRLGGLKIKSATAQAYYVGLERAGLAVPGLSPPLDALCVAPFGMEEGSEVALEHDLGLVVGEPVTFRFFGSSTRKEDTVGSLVDPAQLYELAPIETALEGQAGRVAQVRLQARISETGTLELCAVEGSQRWKLSFDLRAR